MKLAHPVLLLLGAGATRGGLDGNGVLPPLDGDFFEIAGQIKGHGTPELARKVLRDVWSLYRKVSGVGLESYYRDIETREKIGSFARSANKPKDWKKRQQNLEELIRRVIIHTTCKPIENHLQPVNSNLHEKILERLKKGDSILTFNYDLLIEQSFPDAKIWTPRGGYGVKVHGIQSEWSRNWLKHRNKASARKTKIELLKLHGSVNWTLYKTRQIRLKGRPFVVRAGRSETVSILPPGWKEQIDRNPYKLLWKKARLKLERCKTIIIVGYSLPDADLLARALFAEAVRSRAARKDLLKQLYLVDPVDSVKEKFVELFVPALGAHGRVFRYQGIAQLADALGQRLPRIPQARGVALLHTPC